MMKRSMTLGWISACAVLFALAALPAAFAEEGGGEAEPLENRLKWSTASEVDNFGFDVYRAETEEGPFTRLTEKPIAGAGTSDVPSEYVFVDDTIEAGKGYWYFVESISMSGEREKFTPVFPAKPKGVAAEEG